MFLLTSSLPSDTGLLLFRQGAGWVLGFPRFMDGTSNSYDNILLMANPAISIGDNIPTTSVNSNCYKGGSGANVTPYTGNKYVSIGLGSYISYVNEYSFYIKDWWLE